MEMSIDEKTEIFKRLGELEKSQVGLQKTVVIAGALLGAFLTISTTIGGWWLNYNFTKFDQMYQQIIVQGVQYSYIEDRFSSHTGDSRNHPDNTERVNTVIRDVLKLEERQAAIQRTMSEQYKSIIGILSELKADNGD